MTGLEGPARPGQGAWGRLASAFRPGVKRGHLLPALLCALLGFAFVVQVRSTQDTGLEGLRQSDLVRILDDVNQRAERLQTEARDLEDTRSRLTSGSSGTRAALQAAEDRAKVLGILAGTLPATGPGIELTVSDPKGKVGSDVLLDTLEELRDAGAEAVQINGSRVVASSSFGQDADGLQVDGTTLHPPYRILAIGNPQTMGAAMEIPGGISETVRGLGATVRVVQDQSMVIDALQTPRPPRYARPVPAPTPTQ
jgi:uncharacterized protein YlxW (UPF0749 family)